MKKYLLKIIPYAGYILPLIPIIGIPMTLIAELIFNVETGIGRPGGFKFIALVVQVVSIYFIVQPWLNAG